MRMIRSLSLSGITVVKSGIEVYAYESSRSPCRAAHRLHLASTDASDIIQAIRQASEYLRPNYLTAPFSVDIPEILKDEALPEIPCTPGDDFDGFDRTLAAYCR